EVDEVALLLLRHLARAAGHDLLTAGGGPSPGMVALVQQGRAAAVLVASVAPGGLTETRYLSRRLRGQFPGLRIVVGRWGRRRVGKKTHKLLLAAGADRVVSTLREARRQLAQFTHTPGRLQ